MKKALSLILALVTCLSLCACGGTSGTKISKEELLSAAVPMTMDIVQQITATGTGKDFAKTLISNTYTFTGKVYAEEADYVGVGIKVPNADGELVGYDYYSSLSFYVYLPAEELASVRYDDTISFVGTITDVFREERKDEMSSEFSFPVTVIVLGDAYITE